MPYNVACVNGHRLRGERTEGYQALRCPSCGEAVFILPRSPLPEPPVPAAPKRTRQPPDVMAAYAGDDAPHALVDPPAWTRRRQPPSAAQRQLNPRRTEDRRAWPTSTGWMRSVPEPPRPAAAPRRRPRCRPPTQHRPAPRSPARAILQSVDPRADAGPAADLARVGSDAPEPAARGGLVVLVLGAVTVKRWRQRLEDLPRIAEIGRTEGFKKLDSGDFFAAKKILADAAAAVDALGGRFEGADAIRQGAREAAIFTDLVPRTLEDLVEEAATFRDVTGWSAHFRAMYQGRSILFETTITAVPDPSKPGSRYEDAYRILVGRGSKPEAQGRIDFTGFELFDLAQPKVGEIKLLGARLAALEFNVAENTWFLTLEPDSGVFMTHTQALEALHWPTGEPPRSPDHDPPGSAGLGSWSSWPGCGESADPARAADRRPWPSSHRTWPPPRPGGPRDRRRRPDQILPRIEDGAGVRPARPEADRGAVRLPAKVRYVRAPVRAERRGPGDLEAVDGRLVGDVLTLELLPADHDRLDREVARTRPDDFATRRTWALWAERRGRELNDPKLAPKGSALEAEALWTEASRPGADADRPGRRCRRPADPASLREALYHRGFRALGAQARTAAAVDDLAERVPAALPRSADTESGRGARPEPAEADPATAYRAAAHDERGPAGPAAVRRPRREVAQSPPRRRPGAAAGLADEAARTLPDRPAVADKLRQRGLAEAERGVATMRQSEVEELARTFRANGQEDRARRLLEEWLGDRRKNRLSASDAEGRILLAANYEKLLGDRATAGQLLSEAAAIEPESRDVADAFLRLGYRKGEGGWFDPAAARTTADATPAATSTPSRDADRGDSLRGLTQAQARSRMGGKPDRVIRAASQGMIVEQWIYQIGKTDQYLMFRIDSTTAEPRVSGIVLGPALSGRCPRRGQVCSKERIQFVKKGSSGNAPREISSKSWGRENFLDGSAYYAWLERIWPAALDFVAHNVHRGGCIT